MGIAATKATRILCPHCGPNPRDGAASRAIENTGAHVTTCVRLSCGHAWHRTVRNIGGIFPGSPRNAGLRERGQWNIRDTFISLALSAGEDPGWVAKVCSTSEEIIFRHYRTWIPGLNPGAGTKVGRIRVDAIATNSNRGRTLPAISLLETPPSFAYRRIAPQAARLRLLGMSDLAIGRALGVTDKTVTKAIGWFQRHDSGT